MAEVPPSEEQQGAHEEHPEPVHLIVPVVLGRENRVTVPGIVRGASWFLPRALGESDVVEGRRAWATNATVDIDIRPPPGSCLLLDKMAAYEGLADSMAASANSSVFVM